MACGLGGMAEERAPESRRYERDPVSGEQVDVQDAAHVEYQDRLYYFASTENEEAFMNHPERYITPEVAAEATRPAP